MNNVFIFSCATLLVAGLALGGCAAPTDPASADESTDSSEDGLTADAAKDAAKDKSCFADLYLGTTRLNNAVEASLGKRAFCKNSDERTITKGADYYYGASVSCAVVGQPDAAKTAAFASSMAAQGFHGWSVAPSQGGGLTAAGLTTTRVCSAYPGAAAQAAVTAAKDRACFGALFAVERVERAVSKAANAGALCAVSSPRQVGVPGSYYYLGDIECTIVTSCSSTTADIVKNLSSAGYYGFKALDRAGTQVVAGQSTTRDCKSYTSAPPPPKRAAAE